MAEEKKQAEQAKEDTRTFAERLAYVQKVLKAPKSKYNKFGEYYYRSLEDIFEAVKDLCEENGLLLVMTDKPIMLGDWHYIEATARVYDSKHFPTIFIENSSSARETLEKKKSDAAQITGAASSYARKYALNGLFLIDDTKDPDTDEYTRQNADSNAQAKKNATAAQKADTGAGRAASEPITVDEAKNLDGLLKPNQKSWVLTHCGVDSLSKLTKEQYVEVINGLKKNAETKGKA